VGFNDGFADPSDTRTKDAALRTVQDEPDARVAERCGHQLVAVDVVGVSFLSDDGYLPGVNFDTQNTFNGADVAMRLDDANRCFLTAGGKRRRGRAEQGLWPFGSRQAR